MTAAPVPAPVTEPTLARHWTFSWPGPKMPDVQPKRCSWVNVDHELMREYHDREWGVPAHDDRRHFEFLILEAAQAGLSWSIVLNKRDTFVGSTVIYAHMQAVGMVNDHFIDCFRYREVRRLGTVA